MKKKVTSIGLVLIMLLLLIGCNDNSYSVENTTKNKSKDKDDSSDGLSNMFKTEPLKDTDSFKIVFESYGSLDRDEIIYTYYDDGRMEKQIINHRYDEPLFARSVFYYDVDELRNAVSLIVNKYDFFDLTEHISAKDVMDGSNDSLIVTFNGKTKDVGGSNPLMAEGRDAKKFSDCYGELRALEAITEEDYSLWENDSNYEQIKEMAILVSQVKLEIQSAEPTYQYDVPEDEEYFNYTNSYLTTYVGVGYRYNHLSYTYYEKDYYVESYKLEDGACYFVVASKDGDEYVEGYFYDNIAYQVLDDMVYYGSSSLLWEVDGLEIIKYYDVEIE